MENISATYLHRAETWMLITTLFYFFMNGAQIFETAVIVPKWSAAAPQSFQIFRQPHHLDFKWFWIVVHTLHEITFIIAIVFCWNLDIRNGMLILFAIHFAVRVWTLMYFAPKIISFQQSVNGGAEIKNIVEQAKRWRQLNYFRVGVFMVVALGLVPLYLQLSGG